MIRCMPRPPQRLGSRLFALAAGVSLAVFVGTAALLAWFDPRESRPSLLLWGRAGAKSQLTVEVVRGRVVWSWLPADLYRVSSSVPPDNLVMSLREWGPPGCRLRWVRLYNGEV